MEVMKRLRQQAIAELVDQRAVHTQHELVAALGRLGYRATQATVSRDVREMGLVKVSRGGTLAYALPDSAEAAERGGEQRLADLLRDLPIDIRPSGTLLVIRAVPGTAHAIAAALDRARWPEALGTIAGDDTLFVACPDSDARDRLLRRLVRLGQ